MACGSPSIPVEPASQNSSSNPAFQKVADPQVSSVAKVMNSVMSLAIPFIYDNVLYKLMDLVARAQLDFVKRLIARFKERPPAMLPLDVHQARYIAIIAMFVALVTSSKK